MSRRGSSSSELGVMRMALVNKNATIVQAITRGFCTVEGRVGVCLHLQWKSGDHENSRKGYRTADLEVRVSLPPARAKLSPSFAGTGRMYVVLRSGKTRYQGKRTRRWFFGRTPVAVGV